ncbi:MAG: hypothetical protein Q4B64_11365 [Spirochaetales bacterium]|nr:hypothetical protein [Spirochaetales bacterium]
MKKIIAALLIATSVAFFASAEESNTDDAVQALNDAITTVGNEAKNLLEKAKGKITEENKDKAKTKANEIGQKVGEKVKDGAEKTKEAISKREPISCTGTLKVKGSGEKATATIKADDGKTYKLKTMSGSADSMTKLSGYNKKKVKISGILNTETNEVTLTTYKLAD